MFDTIIGQKLNKFLRSEIRSIIGQNTFWNTNNMEDQMKITASAVLVGVDLAHT